MEPAFAKITKIIGDRFCINASEFIEGTYSKALGNIEFEIDQVHTINWLKMC